MLRAVFLLGKTYRLWGSSGASMRLAALKVANKPTLARWYGILRFGVGDWARSSRRWGMGDSFVGWN